MHSLFDSTYSFYYHLFYIILCLLTFSSSKPATDSFPPPQPAAEPRFVILKKQGSYDNLGFTVIGGNAVGIFVQTVQQHSVASGPNGLRRGDQILEVCGGDLIGLVRI